MIAQIAELTGLLAIPAFLLLDLAYRHRRFDAVRHWRLQGLAISIAVIALSIPITLMWAKIFSGRSLLDLGFLGTWGGAVVGILVYELVHYWYHRLAHQSEFLWRFAHQMHHSPESMDAWGAYYSHPVDTFFFTSWVSLVFFPLLGLSPAAGAVGAGFVAVNAMIQHANIRTPRWLGYIIQRPESHSVHHGVHHNNYADLPLWDMVFGTFENPREMMKTSGFYKGASRRVGEMLIGRDVSQPPRRKEEPREESLLVLERGA